jgi:hypothetical protein
MNSDTLKALQLPKMRMIRQQFEVAPAVTASTELDREWSRVKAGLNLPSGAKIAIGVGSRGISNLSIVVRDIVSRLKELGYEPFVTPAMGSHGGATAKGQLDVLRHRGITKESVDAPVEATMEVQPMGEANGIPLFLDRLAFEADGIVLINRVKASHQLHRPHGKRYHQDDGHRFGQPGGRGALSSSLGGSIPI